MTQVEMFGNAEWIGTGDDRDIPVILDKFDARKGEKAEITVLGLGVFSVYVNGVRAHDTECLPLDTQFEHIYHRPLGEVQGYRAYPEVMDISELLCDGENVIAILLGNGWYNKPIWEERQADGRKKVIYRIILGEGENAREHLSRVESAVWTPSHVVDNHYNMGESIDLRLGRAELATSFGGECRPTVRDLPLQKTSYMLSDCPRDRIIRTLKATPIYSGEGYTIYDFGINTTSYPIVELSAKEGERVKIFFSEALDASGKNIDMTHAHAQVFNIIADGKTKLIRPVFGWIAARYARVEGNAKILEIQEVHSDLGATASFDCDNDTLNYLFKTFLHTQLINMHTGIPSDCPQIERRGYTGDGQLVCHAAMMMTDSREFYRKWLYDISDCQDRNSGKVHNTAPYTLAGGGIGGWGSAIVTVPYEYYLRFGDSEPMAEMYDQMLMYLDYLEIKSEGELVIRDRDGDWCLGDWCPPNPVALPPAFVNTYFYIKSAERLIKIARVIGKEEDIPYFKDIIRRKSKALKNAYMDPNNGSFFGCYQGGNAFMLDVGIGRDDTKAGFISHYDALGYYDTGIFGTDIVTRMLFECGRGDIAVRLMSASEPHGFGKFMQKGLTTLPEYWGDKSRSLCHPMFGAVAAYLFDYVLGIRMREGSVGYTDVVISPMATEQVKWAKGSLVTMNGGKISIEYKREGESLTITTSIPEGVKAVVSLNGKEIALPVGESVHTI